MSRYKKDLSKREINKFKKENLKKRTLKNTLRQKKDYKFINIQYRLDNEKDKLILDYIENHTSKDLSRANLIKDILYEYILENKKEDEN